jgi:hypothetical protein
MNRTTFRTHGVAFLAILFTSSAVFAQETPAPASASSVTARPSELENYLRSRLPNSQGRFGLGLSVGNTVTGVTAKLWAASNVAFQATAGEGAEGNDLRTHLDLLFSPGTWTSSDGKYILPFYTGIGAALGHNFASGQSLSYTEGGFRLPLGMSVLIRGNPVELFFEVAPEFTVRSNAALAGKYGVYMDGGIGARYYF